MEDAKQWRGKWDIIITFPNEKNEKDSEEVQERQQRRAKLINRMKKCGLVVVKQLSMDHSFMMLKITALPETFDSAAERTEIELPLKSDATQKVTNTRTSVSASVSTGIKRFMNVINRQYPVEITYAKYDPKARHTFSTLDSRFYRSMDRQRLIMSILKAPKWQGGCDIDINKEVRKHTFASVFPIHTRRGQKRMVEKWVSQPISKFKQPVEIIRDYFGEKIAFYFAFIGLYTQWLLYLSIFGLATFFVMWFADGDAGTLDLNHDITIFYGVMICVWTALFLEGWKRYQYSISFKFAVTDFKSNLEPRPEFKGKYVQGRVTPSGLIKYSEMADLSPEQLEALKNDYVEWSSPATRTVKQMLLGTPIISMFVGAVVAGTFGMLALKTTLEQDGVSGGGIIGSIANALFIIVMNAVYSRVAFWLNKFENHRTDFEYENALIAKTFVFQFINSYIALFFIAFVKKSPVPSWALERQDGTPIPQADLPDEFQVQSKIYGKDIGFCNYSSCMTDLAFQLATIVIVKQLLSNFAEIGMPWLMSKLTFFRRAYTFSKNQAKKSAEMAMAVAGGEETEFKEISDEMKERMPFFEEQAAMSSPKGTFDEYNELMIQYGYMTMFATAFPLASVFSLLNNMFEIKVDANKILFATKRPMYEGAGDMGTWLKVLEVMSTLAVITNTAVVCFTSETLKGSYQDRTEAEYRTCVNACQPFVDAASTRFANYLANNTDPDSWLIAGNAAASLTDSSECLFDCLCTGRCLSLGTRFIVFVIAEHVLLCIKIFIDYFIPDVPKNIARAMVWKDLVGEQVAKELATQGQAGRTVEVNDVWEDEDKPDTDEYVDTEEEQPSEKVQPEVGFPSRHSLSKKFDVVAGTEEGVEL